MTMTMTMTTTMTSNSNFNTKNTISFILFVNFFIFIGIVYYLFAYLMYSK
jgi:hypothetical protein